MLSRASIFQVPLGSFRRQKKSFIEVDRPSSCGCSVCPTLEINDQRINGVCCVTKLKAFLSLHVYIQIIVH